MKKIKEFFTDMTETVSVTKLDGVLMVAIAALSGVILGMLISPRKNAKYGCGNGTTYITMGKMTIGTGKMRIRNKN